MGALGGPSCGPRGGRSAGTPFRDGRSGRGGKATSRTWPDKGESTSLRRRAHRGHRAPVSSACPPTLPSDPEWAGPACLRAPSALRAAGGAPGPVRLGGASRERGGRPAGHPVPPAAPRPRQHRTLGPQWAERPACQAQGRAPRLHPPRPPPRWCPPAGALPGPGLPEGRLSGATGGSSGCQTRGAVAQTSACSVRPRSGGKGPVNRRPAPRLPDAAALVSSRRRPRGGNSRGKARPPAWDRAQEAGAPAGPSNGRRPRAALPQSAGSAARPGCW